MLRHGHPQFIHHELGVAKTGERPDAANQGNLDVLDTQQELLEQFQIKNRLGDGVFGASLDLEFKPVHFLIQVQRSRVGAHADQQGGPRAHRVAANVEARIQIVDDIHQADRIHVEHRRGIQIGAHAGRVAGNTDQVADAYGVAAEQLRLDAQNIAVPAAEVVHGLDSRLLLNQLAGGQRAHPGAGARTVGHVDAVDAVFLAQPRPGDLLGRVHAARRQDLDERHKPAGGQLGAQAGFRGDGYLGGALLRGGFHRRRHARRRSGHLAGLEGADLRPHHPDVFGRGAATAADQTHARGQEAPRVLRHVLRRTQIQAASFDPHRQPRVRHGAQRLPGEGAHLLDGFQSHLRTHRTVQARRIHRPLIEQARKLLRRCPAQPAAVVHRHAGHHHDLRAGRLPRGKHRFAKLIEVLECLQNQQVDACGQEQLDLLAEAGARLGERNGAQRLDMRAERTDGSSHVSGLTRRLARQPHAAFVDRAQFFGNAERAQPHPVRAEGVGLQDLGARAHVFAVDVAHQVGLGHVELVKTAVDEHAPAVEHRAHRAVGHQHPAGELVAKLLGFRNGGGFHACGSARGGASPSGRSGGQGHASPWRGTPCAPALPHAVRDIRRF